MLCNSCDGRMAAAIYMASVSVKRSLGREGRKCQVNYKF